MAHAILWRDRANRPPRTEPCSTSDAFDESADAVILGNCSAIRFCLRGPAFEMSPNGVCAMELDFRPTAQTFSGIALRP